MVRRLAAPAAGWLGFILHDGVGGVFLLVSYNSLADAGLFETKQVQIGVATGPTCSEAADMGRRV